MKPRAWIFDAYGTLFDVASDVASIVRADCFGIAADPGRLSRLWRQKQLEYTWLRALMDRYEDFWRVTEAALTAALHELAIDASDAQRKLLMDAWLTPPLYADARPALEALTGSPVAILSNGSPAMLDSALAHSGLKPSFSHVISVDSIATYKPSPLVYAMGRRALNIPAEEILFVSSNWWDAAGAKAFGYRVCWCNRTALQFPGFEFAPDFTVSSLVSLTSL